MSKSKRFGNNKKPLKVELQKHESHNTLKGISGCKRVKCRIPQPTLMRPGYISRRCSSLLMPGSRLANFEYRKNDQLLVSPETGDHFQVELAETSCKAVEESVESPSIQPDQNFSKQNFVSKKCTTPPKLCSCLAPAKNEKSGQEPSKNTFQFRIKQGKTPKKAVQNSEEAAVPKTNLRSMHRGISSRKGTSSVASRCRIIGGDSCPSVECPQYQCPLKLTPCKAAKTSEKSQFEICPESKPQPLKPACSSGRSSRRGSCVSFTEPVAADIHFCDSPFSKCPGSESDQPETLKEVTHPAPEIDHSTPAATSSEQKEPKMKSKRRKSDRNFKMPIIVVPGGEGNKEEKWKTETSKSSIPSNSTILSPESSESKHKSFIPYARTFRHVDSLSSLRMHPSGYQHQDPSLSVPRSAPQSPVSCPHCAELSKQVGKLSQKVECLENIKILAIRQEVDSLRATVKCLSEKLEKRGQEPRPILEKKSLSTCQFCRGRNLAVLDSFKRQLMETIGKRSYTDVVISIFLRADNIYHVNVRELKSGCSLACFLVTDDAIMEVQRMGLFKEILTFSVIDVRNTLKPKNYALGITFELVNSERQKGGCDSVDRGVCITCKPFLARVLGLPLHRLKHVHTDPEITANYLRKSFQGHFTGKGQK